MIHHLSISADRPEHVAAVLAELLGGISIPFPPNPGAHMAIAGDSHGTAVEVYPAGSILTPNGAIGANFERNGGKATPGAVHFALSVERSLAEIEAIAAREGWQCHVCSRGGDFDVVELWIEDHFMVELLPPHFAARYLGFASLFTAADKAEMLMASHRREPVPEPA